VRDSRFAAMTAMRLACYAAVTAGSLAAGGMSVGWFMDPEGAQTAALQQPSPTTPAATSGEHQMPPALREAQLPGALAALPALDQREPNSVTLEAAPPSLPLRHKALEQPGSRYKVVKVTRGPRGLRREVIARSYLIPARPR
jgi:hypothetical protein